MLREFFDSLRMKCAPGARALGLSHEAVSIAARYRRVGASWNSHLQASRAAILRGAARCEKHKRVLVIGAGVCLDVPVAELAEIFSEVILADVAVSPEARRWQCKYTNRVRAVAWDATGVLEKLSRRRRTIEKKEVLALFSESDPGTPPIGEADLIVSANCLSQLGLIPADQLSAAGADDEFPAQCMEAAAKRHLSWLAERAGLPVLTSDLARLDIAPDGTELNRQTIFDGLPLRAPDQSWRWDLAPIPEWSRKWHRVHEVGVWIDGLKSTQERHSRKGDGVA